MAVAVKNNPETGSHHSMFDRLPVASLLGVVYVLGSLAVVFKAIPRLWQDMLHVGDSFGSVALMILLMLAAATGLVYRGARLLAPMASPGLRAGISVAFVGLVIIVIVTR